MIIFKITEEVAKKAGLQYEDLPEIVGKEEQNFLMDVELLENGLLNFYYMNQFDGFIQAFPITPMLDNLVPEFVLGPSITGDIQRAIFFDGLPFSDEVKSIIHQSGKQFKWSKISTKENNLLHSVYETQRTIIHKEIARRIARGKE
ncbi:hypothetical protein SAMN02745116_01230 [Pilibacter termitis]|uniref:Uncharacterized protein n=1 Tax=Pilibacter termitis TaxID=263852 RepID=A0A1T4MXQ3_9ENTE|nr:hypothetical protein [Pilibacter termitis]SJZ71438.1 hypothetical protein SAMN02745116_01230 [Pilibacter termitis]